MTDAQNQVYEFTYNKLGWLTAEKDPLNRSQTQDYGRDGEVKRWTNRRSQSILMAYDALGRLTNRWGTNTDSVSWTYNHSARRRIRYPDARGGGASPFRPKPSRTSRRLFRGTMRNDAP